MDSNGSPDETRALSKDEDNSSSGSSTAARTPTPSITKVTRDSTPPPPLAVPVAGPITAPGPIVTPKPAPIPAPPAEAAAVASAAHSAAESSIAAAAASIASAVTASGTHPSLVLPGTQSTSQAEAGHFDHLDDDEFAQADDDGHTSESVSHGTESGARDDGTTPEPVIASRSSADSLQTTDVSETTETDPAGAEQNADPESSSSEAGKTTSDSTPSPAADEDASVVGTVSEDETQEPAAQEPRDPDTIAFAEELGIKDLMYPLTVGRGRMFSAAGPKAPVVEFTDDFVVMHPPHKPFMDQGPSEDIVIKIDRRGVLLNELGTPKHIAGAKFRGNSLWYSGEQKPNTLKHFAIWFDQHGMVHKLYVNNEPLTTDIIYRLRNKTHDGELSIFPDIKTD